MKSVEFFSSRRFELLLSIFLSDSISNLFFANFGQLIIQSFSIFPILLQKKERKNERNKDREKERKREKKLDGGGRGAVPLPVPEMTIGLVGPPALCIFGRTSHGKVFGVGGGVLQTRGGGYPLPSWMQRLPSSSCLSSLPVSWYIGEQIVNVVNIIIIIHNNLTFTSRCSDILVNIETFQNGDYIYSSYCFTAIVFLLSFFCYLQ